MSHLALYRKYRPQSFDQVRGQYDAVAYLQSIITSGRVPHAILLTGSRGIGKTTLARIFGKSLGIDPHDIYEIDAASNNGVDDVRTLINEVNTLPLSSQYKLYILDEVHMFSKQAFNALLKVLEEPPKHVLFVFATTELHKVLPTIISRCQVIQLKKPTSAIIAQQVIDVAKAEQRLISLDHALLIANRANGSFRDALVILDQVIEQTAGNEITSDAIQHVGLRMIDHIVYEFLEQFKNRNSEKLITMIHEIGAGNRELLINFVEKLVQSMRTVLYIRHAPGLWKIAREDFATDQIELLQACSDHEIITPKILTHFLQVLDAMKQSTIPEIPIELAIIGILSTIQPVNQ
jgi:DNA polymerase-3 subunit gamma/tau